MSELLIASAITERLRGFDDFFFHSEAFFPILIISNKIDTSWFRHFLIQAFSNSDNFQYLNFPIPTHST